MPCSGLMGGFTFKDGDRPTFPSHQVFYIMVFVQNDCGLYDIKMNLYLTSEQCHNADCPVTLQITS